MYRCTRALFRIVAAPLFGLRVEGREHVPRQGPGVLVALHRSWLDPACVGAACPRQVRFLILDRVYNLWWARWFFRRLGGLPVGASPASSAAGLRRALDWLGQGQLLGVFPEGRVIRAGVEAPLHPGAALLAMRAGAPVIPLAIDGSDRAWPHGRYWPRPARVRVRFGSPLAPPGERGREALSRFIRQIEARLRELDGQAGRAR